MSIDTSVHIVQNDSLLVQLVAHLYAQIPLSANTLSQHVELIVLIPQYLFVVAMDLLIREIGLVGRCVRIGLVAIWTVEE